MKKFTDRVSQTQREEKYDSKEHDFLGTKSLEEELANLDASTSDMQNLNLFGLSMDVELDETTMMD